MIDLNKIRSVKTLNVMKKELSEFLVNSAVRSVYVEEMGWGEEDYEADIEQAQELLDRVEKRVKSLSKHLAKTAPKA